MAVYISSFTGQWWENLDGSPLVGGTLSTFAANTSTPLSTYSDNLGLTPNPVVITLDALGQPAVSGVPVELWLLGGQPYKFVLKDAGGATRWTFDNISGVNDPSIAQLGINEWLQTGLTPAFVSTNSFSVAGDQTNIFAQDRRLQTFSGAISQYGTIAFSTLAAGFTTVTLVMDGGVALTNPVTAVSVGLLNPNPPSISAGELTLGGPIFNTSSVTPSMFGPLGSNMVAFTVPPNVVASAGGAGNQVVTGTVNGIAGSLVFNKTAHGRRTGEVIQLTTSNTLPGGTALSTSYIVFVNDANNFGLFNLPARWQFEFPFLDPVTIPGGLTWGNPLPFTTAGVGNQTVTPGFIAPTGVTRIYAIVTGGGGGGTGAGNGGGAGGTSYGILTISNIFNAINVGAATAAAGGNSTFVSLAGNGGGQGAVSGGTGGTASGGIINIRGGEGFATAGGNSIYGGAGGNNTGLGVFGSGVGGAGGNGSNGVIVIQW